MVTTLQTGELKERLTQLQRCMRNLQESRDRWSHGSQDRDSLGAILALMAAVLTECDLHCHSQTLGAMAKRLGENTHTPTHTNATAVPPSHTHRTSLWAAGYRWVHRNSIAVESMLNTVGTSTHVPTHTYTQCKALLRSCKVLSYNSFARALSLYLNMYTPPLTPW